MTTRPTPIPLGFVSGRIVEGLARRIGLAAASRIRVGCLTMVMPDGSHHEFGDRTSQHRGEIRFENGRALAHMLLHGETGAGEAYMDGGWTSPDLSALLDLAVLNRGALALSRGWWRVPGQLGRTLTHRNRRNTRTQSRRNIAAHYDPSAAWWAASWRSWPDREPRSPGPASSSSEQRWGPCCCGSRSPPCAWIATAPRSPTGSRWT